MEVCYGHQRKSKYVFKMQFGEEAMIGTGPRAVGQGYTFGGSGGDSTRQKFTGYERDEESNLDFAQARMHDYNHGRFTSPDPTLLSVNGFNPQSWNRYVYVLNNPHFYTDPLGLWEIEARAVCKTNKDGTCKTYKNGKEKIDKVIVTAIKSQDGDDAAKLAEQLGLTGKDAEKFAEKIGDSDSIRLSEQGGLVGRVFDAVEDGLALQSNWENKNFDKLDELAAKKEFGPANNDCSGTSCSIGLSKYIPKIGTNILDPMLDTEAKNVAESDAQVGDIIRYAKADNIATHFANFIFRNDDGTPVAFSKSGVKGRYEIRYVFGDYPGLEVEIYGTVSGRNANESGFYRRR
ncbi:MAG: RHS repeat-associated core domain-containing protein [Pyrinomonadaceae bacterium]